MKPPRYQDEPGEQRENIPYSQKRPDRFRTAKQRAADAGEPDDYEQGEAYYRRPVNIGHSNLKRPKR